MTWDFTDLSDSELREFASRPCQCKHRNQTGTRNGYTCPAHRAVAELARRLAEFELLAQ